MKLFTFTFKLKVLLKLRSWCEHLNGCKYVGLNTLISKYDHNKTVLYDFHICHSEYEAMKYYLGELIWD